MKIIKTVATIYQILRLKCTKSNFCDLAAEANSAPRDPLDRSRGPTSNAKRGEGTGEEGKGGKGMEGKGSVVESKNSLNRL